LISSFSFYGSGDEDEEEPGEDEDEGIADELDVGKIADELEDEVDEDDSELE
jgi:hypothetical protein